MEKKEGVRALKGKGPSDRKTGKERPGLDPRDEKVRSEHAGKGKSSKASPGGKNLRNGKQKPDQRKQDQIKGKIREAKKETRKKGKEEAKGATRKEGKEERRIERSRGRANDPLNRSLSEESRESSRGNTQSARRTDMQGRLQNGKGSGLKRLSSDQIRKETWRAGNLLYPVPVVMVSCGREGEKPNIITAAWAGTVCSEPPMVSISVRKERYSHDLIQESREFVINLVTEDLVKECDFCGVRSGRDLDKFDICGLTSAKASKLSLAPLIAESPVNLECQLEQVLELGSHDLFLARVIAVDVDSRLLDQKGTLHLERAGLCAYSHGSYYQLGEKLGTFGFSVKKKDAG